MLGKFPSFGSGEKNGPGIMESLKAVGEVAELLADIRNELRYLNGNIRDLNATLTRFTPKEVVESVNDKPA